MPQGKRKTRKKPSTNGRHSPGLRILWASDAPDAHSGYSVETALTVPRLIALGHEVALLATFGHHGAIREWQGIRVYPGGADPFANDVIGHAARDWQADIVITLKDSHVFRPEALQGLRWTGLVPVDHEPCPPSIVETCRHMYRPIAYAPNGFQQLRAAGLDPLYCPHAYDPAVFNPQDKGEARRFLGIPDEWFIIGTVAVNRGGIPSRKAWPQNLEAFALFAKDKPNARYFLHTDLAADGYEGGINLGALCAQLGISDKVLFCDQEKYRRGGFPENYLNAFYNAIDVLNATSLGEGFGIPVLEAQGAGTPVIVSDFAAQRDLCFAGWKVEEGLKFYDGQGAWVFIPQPEAIASAMLRAYRAITGPFFGLLPGTSADEELRVAQAAQDFLNGRGPKEGAWQVHTMTDGSLLRISTHEEYVTALHDLAVKGAREYQIDTVIQRYWQPALAELQAQIANEGSRGVLRIIRPEEVLYAA